MSRATPCHRPLLTTPLASTGVGSPRSSLTWRTISEMRSSSKAVYKAMAQKAHDQKLPVDSVAVDGLYELVSYWFGELHKVTVFLRFSTRYWPRSMKAQAPNLSFPVSICNSTLRYSKYGAHPCSWSHFGHTSECICILWYQMLAIAHEWFQHVFGFFFQRSHGPQNLWPKPKSLAACADQLASLNKMPEQLNTERNQSCQVVQKLRPCTRTSVRSVVRNVRTRQGQRKHHTTYYNIIQHNTT